MFNCQPKTYARRKLGRHAASWLSVLCWAMVGVCDTAYGMMLFRQETLSQDKPTIVFRDLSILKEITVTDFDDSGIRLSNGRQIYWDEVVTADVAEERKWDFQSRLSMIGDPMFRLKTRLRNQDWAGAGDLAKTLYEPLRTENSPNKQLDFLTCLAAMRGRLFAGDRAGAVVPFLLAASIQSSLDESSQTALADLLLPTDDVINMISGQIVPYWFDPTSVPAALESLQSLVNAGRISNSNGVAVYLASFAVSQNNFLEADRMIAVGRSQPAQPEVENWIHVVEIERYFVAGEIGRAELLIDQNFNRLSDGARAMLLYLQGVHATENPQKQILSLVSVPALFGDRFPNLSASALFEATVRLKKQGDAKEARILRNELLRRYPNTYHGRLAKKEVN